MLKKKHAFTKKERDLFFGINEIFLYQADN